MGGRGFESRQKRPKLKDENFSILGDASFSHKKSIPDQKGARSSASISRVCPGRVGADPGTHLRLRVEVGAGAQRPQPARPGTIQAANFLYH